MISRVSPKYRVENEPWVFLILLPSASQKKFGIIDIIFQIMDCCDIPGFIVIIKLVDNGYPPGTV